MNRRKSLPNPECEYGIETLEAELMQSMISMRKALHLTQKELSLRTGIHQADISKFENDTRKPSLKLLRRLAESMDAEIKIELVQKNK